MNTMKNISHTSLPIIEASTGSSSFPKSTRDIGTELARIGTILQGFRDADMASGERLSIPSPEVHVSPSITVQPAETMIHVERHELPAINVYPTVTCQLTAPDLKPEVKVALDLRKLTEAIYMLVIIIGVAGMSIVGTLLMR